MSQTLGMSKTCLRSASEQQTSSVLGSILNTTGQLVSSLSPSWSPAPSRTQEESKPYGQFGTDPKTGTPNRSVDTTLFHKELDSWENLYHARDRIKTEIPMAWIRCLTTGYMHPCFELSRMWDKEHPKGVGTTEHESIDQLEARARARGLELPELRYQDFQKSCEDALGYSFVMEPYSPDRASGNFVSYDHWCVTRKGLKKALGDYDTAIRTLRENFSPLNLDIGSHGEIRCVTCKGHPALCRYPDTSKP